MANAQIPVPQAAPEQKLSNLSMEVLKEKELEEEVPLEKRNARLYALSIFFSVIIFVAVGVLFYFKLNYFKEDAKKVVEVLQEEVQGTPAPVSSPVMSKGSISLEILNGTGKAGEAGRVGKRIEELGYKVVKVGNAERAEKTQVLIKKSLEGTLGDLFIDLSRELNVSSPSGYLEEGTASARIILGS